MSNSLAFSCYLLFIAFTAYVYAGQFSYTLYSGVNCTGTPETLSESFTNGQCATSGSKSWYASCNNNTLAVRTYSTTGCPPANLQANFTFYANGKCQADHFMDSTVYISGTCSPSPASTNTNWIRLFVEWFTF